jgi:DNA-binding PadR family transcriptional regulator
VLDESIHIDYIHCVSKDQDPASLLPLPPVTFHILVALSGGDRHGYAILQDVEARTGGELRIQPGTLYRSIQRMLEQGLIAESRVRPDEDDERRRYYLLTPFGREVAEAEARRLAQMVRLARAAGLVGSKA